ncbi:glutamine amidotransferase [Ktedonosporobacter rubrisoli]|uniref:Lipid II isoglutaminyl synthase (glutamine-hydrolyzing) subunit GatD n=1 Tax=Ktedonosporobacter rubrisoli TaxID=2509675 RepID=A0A4P6K3S5_KTERU|nr:glutamine amidotransferase [Ktedonosporobacter rubrisoli]QBD82146.1 glutamine amidotransferase [Ktedonosporobacter rubrisoli]
MTQSFKSPFNQSLTLTLGHLYPDQLNLYGDRGNILTLRRRCQMRGIELRVVGLGMGDALAPDEYDLLFIGGGQDKEQAPVAQDLYEVKGIGLWAAIEDDMPVLAVCGGYQLLAHYYRPAEGPDMRGLGVFDAWTIHRGWRSQRCVGDIAISWNGSTLVGFENHGGQTYLGTAKPLGRVLKGYGNNAEDHSEGAIYRNTFGTYMHGSLLPKNPHFADYLLDLALRRKYGARLDMLSTEEPEASNGANHSGLSLISGSTNGIVPTATLVQKSTILLTQLDDKLEWEAHASILERLGLHSEAAAVLRRLKG